MTAGLRRLRPGLPIIPMAVLFGATFGILARSTGHGPVFAVLMSATVFAGAAQFAYLALLPAGAWTAAVSAVLVNARYLPMGISISPSLASGPLRRLLHSHLLVDESWAIARQADGSFDRWVLLALGGLLYAAWVLGTTLGALVPVTIPDPKRLGLDAAFPALFLALLVPQVKDRRALAAAALGGAIALALVPLTPPGISLLPACAAALIGARRR